MGKFNAPNYKTIIIKQSPNDLADADADGGVTNQQKKEQRVREDVGYIYAPHINNSKSLLELKLVKVCPKFLS